MPSLREIFAHVRASAPTPDDPTGLLQARYNYNAARAAYEAGYDSGLPPEETTPRADQRRYMALAAAPDAVAIIGEPSGTMDHDYEALWRASIERRRATLAALAEARYERDMLAKRCAEQARQIADLIAPRPVGSPRQTIGEAIAKMQRAGLR